MAGRRQERDNPGRNSRVVNPDPPGGGKGYFVTRSRPFVVLVGIVLCLATTGSALASPVAQTEEERALYGRTFLEPAASYDYIQFGEEGKGEFYGGFKLLEKIYPR